MNQSTSHTSKGDKSILPRLFPHTQMCDFTSFCCLTIYFTTAASIFTYFYLQPLGILLLDIPAYARSLLMTPLAHTRRGHQAHCKGATMLEEG